MQLDTDCSSSPDLDAVTAQRKVFDFRGVCFFQSRRFVMLYVLLASMFISLCLHHACTSSVLQSLPSVSQTNGKEDRTEAD
jgi:hypothetical protein